MPRNAAQCVGIGLAPDRIKQREEVMRRFRRVVVHGLGAFACALFAQEPQSAPYVEKVEVRVRSVLVFITDAKGKPLAETPAPSQLRLLENGAPMEILSVEKARRPAGEAPKTGEPAVASATGAPASPGAGAFIPQYLYVDTSSLQMRSVPRISKVLVKNLPALLANGPLEIVVADPQPRVLVRSTMDAATLRAAIESLPGAAAGKERMYDVRKETMIQMMNGESANSSAVNGSSRVDLRAAIRQELALTEDFLRRLDTWAGTMPYDRASVVYLCSDGFDSDVTEVYRGILLGTHDPQDAQKAMQLQLEFGREAAEVTAKAADVLAGRGATAVLLAFGGSEADFAMSSANLDKLNSSAIHRPSSAVVVSYYARPFEPLLETANRTGGRVVSVETKLPQAIDEVGDSYLVTFRSQAPADGKTHPLEITSATSALLVRAPRAVLTATLADAAVGQAVRALSSSESAGTLPVHAEILDAEDAQKGRRKGHLEVSTDLALIAEALDTLGPGRVRVTVAVEVTKGKPFTQSEEADLDHSGQGAIWSYEANITWPPEATRVAVTIEELKTGAHGSAVAELPAK
jgi:hypothetical protein